MFFSADWIRLGLLLILGLGATGVTNWLGSLVFGGILSLGLRWFTGWYWAWCLQAGLATVFVIPLFLRILRNNFRIAFAIAGIFGIPILFLSRYVFGSTWTFASTDSITFMHLAPVAVLQVLTKVGIINLTQETPKTFPKSQGPAITYKENIYKSGAPSTGGGASSPIRMPDPPRNRFRSPFDRQ